MLNFDVTFEIVTPESAEYGDAESRGFVVENVSLRDAIYAVCGSEDPRFLPYCEADCSPVRSPRWFTFYKVNEGTPDYFETGAEESRSIHLPESLSDASRMRIARLFNVKAKA